MCIVHLFVRSFVCCCCCMRTSLFSGTHNQRWFCVFIFYSLRTPNEIFLFFFLLFIRQSVSQSESVDFCLKGVCFSFFFPDFFLTFLWKWHLSASILYYFSCRKFNLKSIKANLFWFEIRFGARKKKAVSSKQASYVFWVVFLFMLADEWNWAAAVAAAFVHSNWEYFAAKKRMSGACRVGAAHWYQALKPCSF